MKKQFSAEFFSQCPQLQTIQKLYALKELPKEAQMRDKQTQFELLRLLTETKKHKLQLRMNSLIENKKNRYPEQSIYQHSRVTLKRGKKQQQKFKQNQKEKGREGDTEIQNIQQSQTYINANFLTHTGNKIIVSQGPLQSTTADFYQMIEQENIECVLMLCQCIENSKVRCFDYLRNAEVIFSEGTKAVQISKAKFNGKQKQKTFTHVYYKDWPDRGIPQDFQSFSIVIVEALKYKNILIHCSAGLGRSGVVAALLSILQGGQNNPDQKEHTNSNLDKKVNVFREVRRLRESRYQAVQNWRQYAFIYDFLAWYVKTRS